MSTPGSPPPGPRGSHRAAPASGGAAPASPLLLPVLSVLVVLGAIGLAAWMLLTAGDGEEETDPPAVTQPTSQPSDTASSEPTDDDKQNDDKQNDTKKNDDKKNDTKKDDKKDDEKKTDNVAQAVPQVPVYVFNQTTISGLAAETASSLGSAGWNVVGVDNWVGNVPSDTVYYYPGDRAAADRLSKDFPDIERVWPASAPMPAGALTVILADTARK